MNSNFNAADPWGLLIFSPVRHSGESVSLWCRKLRLMGFPCGRTTLRVLRYRFVNVVKKDSWGSVPFPRDKLPAGWFALRRRRTSQPEA